MNKYLNLTPQQLPHAADIQERILELQGELAGILGNVALLSTGQTGGKRRMSPEGLANIRAGTRKRWAKFYAEIGNASAVPKPRRKMSAAGRAAIAARMRARWAAAKRSGRNAL